MDALAAATRPAAKTRKGRRLLEKRGSQLVEEAKTALILAGNKCSMDVQSLLNDLHKIRSPLSTLFSRKHPEHPFEDIQRVETLCTKYDHSLFAFGSSSKKRPFRLILGRLFDGHLLDMQEFNVHDFKPIRSFHKTKLETPMGAKPMVVFQGAAFETDDLAKRAKSLLFDFFVGPKPEKVMLQGLEQVIVCSTFDVASGSGSAGAIGSASDSTPPIIVRRFRSKFSKSGSKLPRVELEEIGPSFKLTLDRTRDPDRERWKQAIKVPKASKERKEKNKSTDSLGKKRGRIHLGTQDFNQIHTVHHGKAKEKRLTAELAAKKRKKTG